jgi:hypothetical protein
MRCLTVTFAALALAAPASAATIGHDRFTSDPYPDEWCGLAGTSVDRVVANFTAGSDARASINVLTTFTAVNGKQLEIRSTGVRTESAPVDNGDGTYSLVHTDAGLSPMFKAPNGPVIGNDVGLVTFVLTFDSSTGAFVGFDVVKIAGQRLPLDSQICEALTS